MVREGKRRDWRILGLAKGRGRGRLVRVPTDALSSEFGNP